MNKKGFTLVEILAIVVLLGIVATITTSFISSIMKKARLDAFKDSVYAAIRSYGNDESYQSFNEIGEIDVRLLPLDNNSLKSGIVKRDENNEIIVVNITNGEYCANGSSDKLKVTEGDCTKNNTQTNNNEENN